MMRPPFAPGPLLLFAAALGGLLLMLQLQLIGAAFERLGLSPGQALLLLAACLLGSAVNLPLATVHTEAPPTPPPSPGPGWRLLRHAPPFTGKTVLALNVGGGLLPTVFALHLLSVFPLPLGTAAAATALVALVCRLASRPLPGFGIAMPVLVAPVATALVALWLAPEPGLRAPLAYVAGTLGVLIGADLSRLGDIRRLGAPVASIGGAGTFDGIFITGIVAVLLA